MKLRHLLLLGLLPMGLAASELPLTVDKAHSAIDVVVKATVDSFTGNLADFQPRVLVDEATGRIVASEITFSMLDLRTGKTKRDAKMQEWEDTAHFPTGRFVMSRLEDGAAGTCTAHGMLDLHGVRHELSFPVTIMRDRQRFAIDGEAVIDTREHALPVIRMMGLLKVDPLVKVRFHLQGELAAK